MSGSSEGVLSRINYIFLDLKDDRTRDMWPNFTTLASILLVYLYFVKKAGPAWMKDKKPYELKNTIMVYNIFQIVTCFYAFFEASRMFITHYNFLCQPIEYSDDPISRRTHNLVWMYLMLKISDLLDTVFFVLRKKDRQISTLHVYHHTYMPLASWFGLKYFPNGHGISLGILNCLVHCVMYTYYLIAGLGPKYQKYLWWKKYVTILQLVFDGVHHLLMDWVKYRRERDSLMHKLSVNRTDTGMFINIMAEPSSEEALLLASTLCASVSQKTQFVIIFFHNLYPLLTGGCGYPTSLHIIICMGSAQFSYMFGNFYYVTYIKKKPEQKPIEKNGKTQTKLHSK